MTAPNTPDEYIEEISIYPPSVAEVETAVLAFIGYTEKANKKEINDRNLKPTEIDSIQEYIEVFGYGPILVFKEITLDKNNFVSGYERNVPFYMYDSLELFFLNGGRKCYIVSVGNYGTVERPTEVTKDDLLKGLEAIEKLDDPTILVIPDAVLLEKELYSVQKTALKQCNDLQDRIAVLDVLDNIDGEWEKAIKAFRDGIGTKYLKYGAAYTPWLKTNLDKEVTYADIREKS